jgi:hypothetical protein
MTGTLCAFLSTALALLSDTGPDAQVAMESLREDYVLVFRKPEGAR